MKNKNLITLNQIIGMLFYSFGVSAIVFTSLGASPIDAATYYANELIPIFDGIIPNMSGQGVWLIIFNTIIAIGLLIFSKRYNIWINILVSISIGLIFNLGLFTYQKIFNITGVMNNSSSLLLRIGIAFIGINMMSFGIAYLAYKKLYGTPFDELAIEVEKSIKKYYLSKIILDGSFLIIASILGIIYKDIFKQIGLFTIVVLAGLGPLINIYINILTKNKNRKEMNNELK